MVNHMIKDGVFLYELRKQIWQSLIETKCYLMGSKHQFCLL